MKNLGTLKLLVILMTIAMLIGMVPMVFAEAEAQNTLVVSYNDGTETTDTNRDHPSRALHFDVYKTPGALAKSAVLTLANGNVVYWEYNAQSSGGGTGTAENPYWQGSENADLSNYEEGY